jgi:hypothetical protein
MSKISLWLTTTWEEESTDTDWGVWSWPWQLFARGKPNRPFFLWQVTDVFQLKVYWTEVQSCFVRARQTVIFCSVLYSYSLHKFDYRLFMYETSKEWRPVERSCSTRDSGFWQDLYVFRRSSSRLLWNSTHAVQLNCILFTQWVENLSH